MFRVKVGLWDEEFDRIGILEIGLRVSLFIEWVDVIFVRVRVGDDDDRGCVWFDLDVGGRFSVFISSSSGENRSSLGMDFCFSWEN